MKKHFASLILGFLLGIGFTYINLFEAEDELAKCLYLLEKLPSGSPCITESLYINTHESR